MASLFDITTQFPLQGTIGSIEPFGSGHINDTYLVRTIPEDVPDYVLQRINHMIFKDVDALTENIRLVTLHLAGRLASANLHPEFRVVQMMPTHTGRHVYMDHNGNYWRLYNYLGGSKSYDLVENPEMAFQGGKAFGIFHHLTSDFDAARLHEVLPGFHDISLRLQKFREVISRNPAGRVNTVPEEIAFAEFKAAEMHTILNLGKENHIPLRVTHNDTKFNNILFNEKNLSVSVIDLDTVMPGYILYDFGDAIRTGASTAAEDEADLDSVHINLALFEAYAAGYLGIAGGFLNNCEKDHLAFSAKFMTYIIGLRFLTDHLDGDRYFKVSFPGHNLRRARTQFKLLQSMEDHFPLMQAIIRKFN